MEVALSLQEFAPEITGGMIRGSIETFQQCDQFTPMVRGQRS